MPGNQHKLAVPRHSVATSACAARERHGEYKNKIDGCRLRIYLPARQSTSQCRQMLTVQHSISSRSTIFDASKPEKFKTDTKRMRRPTSIANRPGTSAS